MNCCNQRKCKAQSWRARSSVWCRGLTRQESKHVSHSKLSNSLTGLPLFHALKQPVLSASCLLFLKRFHCSFSHHHTDSVSSVSELECIPQRSMGLPPSSQLTLLHSPCSYTASTAHSDTAPLAAIRIKSTPGCL